MFWCLYCAGSWIRKGEGTAAQSLETWQVAHLLFCSCGGTRIVSIKFNTLPAIIAANRVPSRRNLYITTSLMLAA